MRIIVFLLLFAALAALAPVAATYAQIVRPPDMKLQYHRAERAWKSGTSLPEALARLNRVVDTLPEDLEARLLRTRVLLDLGDPEAALDDARLVATMDPDNGEAHLLRCEAARLTGFIDEAKEALKLASAQILTGAQSHIRLSFNALQLGLMDQAEAYARVAVASDEGLPGAYRQLALVFLAQERPNDAATLLALGLERGVILPSSIASDDQLASLTAYPQLARFY